MAISEHEGTLTYKSPTGDTHILYPEVKTDDSLSVEGKPADAAAVGTKITNEVAAVNTKMANYMPKSGGTFSGGVTGPMFRSDQLETVPAAGVFSSAGLITQAATGANSNARAGVGYHNVNHSASFMYFKDHTEGFRHITNNGVDSKILDTNNTQFVLTGATVDLDTIKSPGMYRIQTNAYTNGPATVNALASMLFVARAEKQDTLFQILVNYYTGHMAYRGGSTSRWSEWHEAVDKSCFSLSGTTLTITI